jgi:CRP/FNR family transcriptional regulator, cyclic AMP receptor protein
MTQASAKSGLKSLKPGETIFNDGEPADSLFIIQKGQIRLFKPKGKGFIELAVLRAGEVIGEMAYFDEDGSGRKRSCSAAALTHVEVIEISFGAFAKTMQSLNPWFKTIINTLATRLRRTNFRVKELEDNQASSYGLKPGSYEFIKPFEVMRILGTLFLIFKAHGEAKFQALTLNRKVLTLYTNDMYQIMEAKLESIMNILVDFGWMEIREDEDKLPNLILLKNVEIIRQLFLTYNTERHLPDDKKIYITERFTRAMVKILEDAQGGALIDIPNLRTDEENPPKFTKYFDLTKTIESFQTKKIVFKLDHLKDGDSLQVFGEAADMDGKTVIEIDLPKLQKLAPIIRFMNAVRALNEEKN